MDKIIDNIEIYNAEFYYPNFSGREERFNNAGNRYFNVFIDDPALATQLSEDGWNIKIKTPKDEDDQVRHYLRVAISYNHWKYKPHVYLISNGVKTELDEEDLDCLDTADIAKADLSIRPRIWDDAGTPRVKAFLNELYVTVRMSRLAAMYAEQEAPEEMPWD